MIIYVYEHSIKAQPGWPNANFSIVSWHMAMMYDVVHGTAPGYLMDLCRQCGDMRLRSGSRGDYVVPFSRLFMTQKSFRFSGPRAWNSLPGNVCDAPSRTAFANRLKTHTKHLQINNLHIFTIVFHFRHILFLHDLLIHLFFPFHMSDHHLAKGLSVSSVHDSGIHSLLILETRLLYQYSVPDSKHTSSKLRSLPRLFPISLDCLPGFWFLLFSFYALSNDT